MSVIATIPPNSGGAGYHARTGAANYCRLTEA
jgi:hypothetical protein